jgi:hypothetical protein
MATLVRGVGLALLALGCGSDPAPATAPPATANTNFDVENGCRAFAERLCASAEPCCEQGGPFDLEQCVNSYVEKVCTPAAQLVAAGFATYDASSEEACLAAHQRAHDVCYADWEELLAIRRDEETSCRVVTGTATEGQACTTDLQCAPPDGAGSTACVRGECRTIRLLAEGEACPFPLGDVSTCDTGLYCTATQQDDTGTCERATPEGAACEKVFLNPECGLGSYCDLDAGVCRKATNFGGPTCTQDDECVSFICDRAAQICHDARPTAYSLCQAP